METWKILNVENYPIVLWQNEPNRQTNDREVRTTTIREWKEDSISKNTLLLLLLYLPIFYFSFCQKINLHLYKWARLPLLLLIFSVDLDI